MRATPRPSSAQGSLRRFTYNIGHVGTAHQRTAEHHPEAQLKPVIAIGIELPGLDEFLYREVAAGRLKVLADGDDVGSRSAQIAEQGVDFVRSFAQAHHEAGFRECARRSEEHTSELQS